MGKAEFKFRAWDIQNKCFALNQIVGNILYELQFNPDADVLEFFHLMRSTGVSDKNGNLIYEGDVIQFKHYYVNRRWWSTTDEIPAIEEECQKQREDVKIELRKVEFRDGCFQLGYPITFLDVARGQRFNKGQTHSCDTEEKQWDFEAIGNIYANPELLS